MGTERKKLIEFNYGDKHYIILAPTQEQLLRMDMEYRQAFSRAIREGLMTEFEAHRIFDKNGTWTKENDKEITALQMKIVTCELELEKVENEIDGRILSFNIMEARNQLMDLINYKSRLFSAQTAEGYAEAVRLSALTYECTVDDTGERVFGSKEIFCGNQNTEFTATCYSKAMLADVGMSDDDLDTKFTERKWLEKHGYLKTDSTFTQKYYDELVTEDISPATPPPPPKIQEEDLMDLTKSANKRKKSKKRKSTKKKVVKQEK